MSFLLLKSKRSRPPPPAPTRPRAGGSNRSGLVPRAATTAVGRAPMTRGDQRTQQLLQRPRPAPAQGGIPQQIARQPQRGGQMQQQVTRQQVTRQTNAQQQDAAKVQSVISMEEVMEDLRVLEQQQRDSQRKLETIKMQKQHKLDQRTCLESELASLNYSIGEQRAQLLRCREVLGTCTLDLGAAKLRLNKSGDDLKAFDKTLKKSLSRKRKVDLVFRKVHAKQASVANTECAIMRLNAEMKDKIRAAEMKRDETKHREQLLRQSIQKRHLRCKQLEEETARITAESAGLDQDLTTSDQLEASTKLRAKSIEDELASEEARHREAMAAIETQLEDCFKTNLDEQDKAIRAQVEIKRKQPNDLWMLCIEFQKEEGHDESPEPADGNEPPFLDVSKMRVALDVEERGLIDDAKARDARIESIELSKREISGLETEEREASEEANATLLSAREGSNVEKERRQANEEFQANLEKVRKEVEALRCSKLELGDSISVSNAKATEKVSEQREALAKEEVALQDAKTQLVVQTKLADEARTTLDNHQATSPTALEGAKQKAAEAKAMFEQTRTEVDEISNVMDAETQAEVADLHREQKVLIGDVKAKVARLVKKYPALANIVVNHDPNKTSDDLAQEALQEVRTECESRVERARRRREECLQTLVRERKARKKAEKEAALKARAKKQAALEAEAAAEADRAAEELRVREAEHEKRRKRKEEEKAKERARAERKRLQIEKEEKEKRRMERRKQRALEAAREESAVVHARRPEARDDPLEPDTRRKERKRGAVRKAEPSKSIIETGRRTLGKDGGLTTATAVEGETRRQKVQSGKETRRKGVSEDRGRSGQDDAVDRRSRYGVKGQERKSRNERTTIADGGKAAEFRSPKALEKEKRPGSRRRVTFGGLDVDDGEISGAFGTQQRGVDDLQGNTMTMDSEAIYTQPTQHAFSEQILTQLSQEDSGQDRGTSSQRSFSSHKSARNTGSRSGDKKMSRSDSMPRSSDGSKELLGRSKKRSKTSSSREKTISETSVASSSSKKRVQSPVQRASRSDKPVSRHSQTKLSAQEDKSRRHRATSVASSSSKKQGHSSVQRARRPDKPVSRHSQTKLSVQEDKSKRQRATSAKSQKETGTSRAASSQDKKRSRQTSGISSMERGPKPARRRKKKSVGSLASKRQKMQSLGVMDDYDFRF